MVYLLESSGSVNNYINYYYIIYTIFKKNLQLYNTKILDITNY